MCACRVAGQICDNTRTLDVASLALYIIGTGAGWSSLVARRAHNPKVAGSNPAPAMTKTGRSARAGRFLRSSLIARCRGRVAQVVRARHS